jgi:hypothetical protein
MIYREGKRIVVDKSARSVFLFPSSSVRGGPAPYTATSPNSALRDVYVPKTIYESKRLGERAGEKKGHRRIGGLDFGWNRLCRIFHLPRPELSICLYISGEWYLIRDTRVFELLKKLLSPRIAAMVCTLWFMWKPLRLDLELFFIFDDIELFVSHICLESNIRQVPPPAGRLVRWKWLWHEKKLFNVRQPGSTVAAQAGRQAVWAA